MQSDLLMGFFKGMHQIRAGPRHLSREFHGSRKEIQESGPARVIQDFMGIFFKRFFFRLITLGIAPG